ncbi:SsgA family sporulation/cell division regulator [Streptomyces mutabilis]|uniref:SsgA family sporulation/cell division regulator n=1 Tax=Streptomyces mutabilis TaxID=67332 RepID=UPI0034443CED
MTVRPSPSKRPSPTTRTIRTRSACTSTRTTKEITWMFARELLADGHTQLTGSGHGDVSVHRCQDSVHIQLESPEGRADLHVHAKDVTAFLAVTNALVAPGTELDGVDIGRELAAMFGEAA